MARKPTAERQVEIEEAVLHLIATQGTQGLTMARIAAHIGVSEAALYRHFTGKLDIIHATIDASFDRVMEELIQAAGDGDAVTRLHRVFIGQLQFIEDHPGMARILFSDEVHFNATELQRELNAHIAKLLRFIASLLRLGVKHGELPSNLDVEAASALYLGLIQTQLLLWSVNGKKERLMAGAEQIWALYVRVLS